MNEKPQILVVDDNPPMTDTMVDILKVKGYIAYAAYSGSQALDILREQPVDLLLTDARMPDMNGVELYREARKVHPELITFLMTAYAADDIIDKGLGEGIKTVLTKPLEIDHLLMMLSAAMGSRL